MVIDPESFEGPSPIPSPCTHGSSGIVATVPLVWRGQNQVAPPLGPGRALTLPCGWNNAGLQRVVPLLPHCIHGDRRARPGHAQHGIREGERVGPRLGSDRLAQDAAPRAALA